MASQRVQGLQVTSVTARNQSQETKDLFLLLVGLYKLKTPSSLTTRASDYHYDEKKNLREAGAVTRVEYRPSTHYYLEDQKKPDARWRTPLPFPVQVVAKVEAIDEISRGKLTTEYHYHHGYWDGAEREFRGFGMVEQLDTETFEGYHDAGLHGNADDFKDVPLSYFSKPTLTKTWFHQGPVGEEFGDWAEVDYANEYWSGDPQLLGHTEQVNLFLKGYNDEQPLHHPSGRPESAPVRRAPLG